MGLLDIGGNRLRNKQIEQQQKLTDIQVEAQKELADYGMGISKQMFEATGYAAQRRQMEEAGLNPALMYGHAGSGGSTMSASAGSVSGGHASDEAALKQAQLAQQGMALQLTKLSSEIAVNNSIAEKNKAEAEATLGYKKDQAVAETKNIEEITKNTEVQRQGINLQNDYDRIRNYITEKSADYSIETLKWMAGKAREEYEIILNNKEISDKTKEAVIESYKLNNKNIAMEILSKKAGIELSKAQAEKAFNDISQGWEELRIKNEQGTRNLNLQAEANRIKQAYPNLSQISGGAIQELLMFLDKINPWGGQGKGFAQSLGKE
nr:MAG: DNA pilot protein [Microvirus sp.]